MAQERLRAVFMRGGTSKGLMLRRQDLPADQADWAPIFLAAMGSPDPHGRQLDGMGGGISSLSKVCVIGPPSRPDADVDYTFAQVAVGDSHVDYAGNCGNMSSAVGPFAVDEGLVKVPADGMARVVIHNTNTGKLIVSQFPMVEGELATHGDLSIDGVAATAAPIRLDFEKPGGSKTGLILPTGHAVDELTVSGMGSVAASLVDAANPCVFVAAESLGLTGSELPAALDRDAVFLERMERIRCASSVAMGLAADLREAAALQSIPKVAIVSAPQEAETLSGKSLRPDEMDITVRMISVGQPHRAVPVTGSLCLAVACRLRGSIPNRLLGPSTRANQIRIAHPSGVIVVDATVSHDEGSCEVHSATIYRTARKLFAGEVFFRR